MLTDGAGTPLIVAFDNWVPVQHNSVRVGGPSHGARLLWPTPLLPCRGALLSALAVTACLDGGLDIQCTNQQLSQARHGRRHGRCHVCGVTAVSSRASIDPNHGAVRVVGGDQHAHPLAR